MKLLLNVIESIEEHYQIVSEAQQKFINTGEGSLKDLFVECYAAVLLVNRATMFKGGSMSDETAAFIYTTEVAKTVRGEKIFFKKDGAALLRLHGRLRSNSKVTLKDYELVLGIISRCKAFAENRRELQARMGMVGR